MAGFRTSRRAIALTLAIFLGTVIAAGCGGGGSSGGEAEDSPEDLYVVTFSVPDFSGIFLNEQVSFVFSEKVKASSLNFDSIRIRTGPNGGVAPRGEFVRGTFTAGRVDRSQKNVVTFLPSVPNKVDLSDTGYEPMATYTVVVPAWPDLNTVKNRGNEPMVQLFTSQFTTLPGNAAQLFLDSDFPGNPDVVGIHPANNASDISVSTSVVITFSEPLLPGTVLPSDPDNPNIVLLNDSASPGFIIPVSYFIAQTRESVTVTLNPLAPLEVDRSYKVIVTPFVTDLVGSSVTPYEASFTTGGTPPPPTAFIESFDQNFREDVGLTTANWNNRYDTFVGGVGDYLTAAFSPFAGDGADGALSVGPSQTVTLDTGTSSQRIYRYTSVNIAIGGTLRATGDYALVIQCQGDVTIAGAVDLTGSAGGKGVSGAGMANEDFDNAGDATGGEGGAAGAGGGSGGGGGNSVTGTGGFLLAQDGFGPGGGHGGHYGDTYPPLVGSYTLAEWQAWSREAGGGGGHAEDPFNWGTSGGDSATKGSSGEDGGIGGAGGDLYGEDDFSDAPLVNLIPMLTKGFGGSGGGGGGAEDDSGIYKNDLPANTVAGDDLAANDDEGGGGGGGGGGAFQVIAYGDISITGMIFCNGGRGGDTEDAFGNIGEGDAGGGGSGGSIWVQAYGDLTIGAGAVIACTGGAGGNFATSRVGGVGAAGYIRLEDDDGTISGIPNSGVVPDPSTGTYSPSLSLNSVAYSTWFDAVGSSPRFGFPIETYTLNGGTVTIEYQTTREDNATPGDNPDLDPEQVSVWVSGGAIDTINKRWIRFRVSFFVPDDHPFDTPMPAVDYIEVPISF
jgi:Bacterial Ig-like domain